MEWLTHAGDALDSSLMSYCLALASPLPELASLQLWLSKAVLARTIKEITLIEWPIGLEGEKKVNVKKLFGYILTRLSLLFS